MNTSDADVTLRELKKLNYIPEKISASKIATDKLVFQQTLNLPATQTSRLLLHLNNSSYYYGHIKNRQAEDNSCCFIFKDGAYYMGQCRNGKFQGKGKLIKYSFAVKQTLYSYEGEWKKGKPHGNGKEVIANSMTYQGTFVEGKKHGSGKMIYKDNSQYDGEFYANRVEGYGTYKTTAHEWTGQWKDGYLQGQGKQISFGNGQDEDDKGQQSTYKGGFERGLKHGKGVYKWGKNLSEYSGNFKNGQLDGEGRFKIGDTQYVGQWKKGVQVYMDSISRIALKRVKKTQAQSGISL